MLEKKIDIEETHIHLKTDIKDNNLEKHIIQERYEIKKYIQKNPLFLTSLKPLKIPKNIETPLIIKNMLESGIIAEVGPMASVAGTISESSIEYLINEGSKHSIIENGGDISLKTNKKTICGIYAGNSSLSGTLGFQLPAQRKPLGICTSSGTVGPSLSFGRADSVTVISKHASHADALATSIANKVQNKNDEDAIQEGLDWADEFKEYYNSILIILNENAGTIGKLPQLVKTNKKETLSNLFEI